MSQRLQSRVLVSVCCCAARCAFAVLACFCLFFVLCCLRKLGGSLQAVGVTAERLEGWRLQAIGVADERLDCWRGQLLGQLLGQPPRLVLSSCLPPRRYVLPGDLVEQLGVVAQQGASQDDYALEVVTSVTDLFVVDRYAPPSGHVETVPV